MDTIPVKRARIEFSELLNFVAYGDKKYAISRNGKPIAVMISIKEWEELQNLKSRIKIIND